MPDLRPIRLPAKDFADKPLPVIAASGFKALRLHGMTRPAVQFRNIPSHRFSHPEAGSGLLYLANDPETCLWESFGDVILNPGSVIPLSTWMSRRMSEIRATAELRFCDLTDLKVRSRLKVDLSALTHPELEIPQAWGLAIMDHPDAVDGFHYNSRFTNRHCTVLFGGKRLTGLLESEPLGKLTDLDISGQFLEGNEIALV